MQYMLTIMSHHSTDTASEKQTYKYNTWAEAMAYKFAWKTTEAMNMKL
jgi:hypothetical protein